jgi:hypothetical protein
MNEMQDGFIHRREENVTTGRGVKMKLLVAGCPALQWHRSLQSRALRPLLDSATPFSAAGGKILIRVKRVK